MTWLYLGVGTGVAAMRLLLELVGKVRYPRKDSPWVLAQACTDTLFWPLVLTVVLLQRATAHSS